MLSLVRGWTTFWCIVFKCYLHDPSNRKVASHAIDSLTRLKHKLSLSLSTSSVQIWCFLPLSVQLLYALLYASYIPPDHLLLDRSPNIGPLISRWELDKFQNCWNKSLRTSNIRTLLHQQFLILLISQRDMSGPRLGALSNNRWSGVPLYARTGVGFAAKFVRARAQEHSPLSTGPWWSHSPRVCSRGRLTCPAPAAGCSTPTGPSFWVTWHLSGKKRNFSLSQARTHAHST